MRLVMLLGIAAVAAAAVYLNNSSYLAQPPADRPSLLAHRGLAQTYDKTGLTGETCTATRIDPPVHDYLENTIASMRAAFELGADVVELDIHPTTDGHFAVFHDWTLDCRTNGHGVTREHSLAQLKALDVGYGYSADRGKTFPFRGKGVGLMPSLDEVLAAFPDKPLLINVKSNDPGEGRLLAARLSVLPSERLEQLMVYGGDRPIAVLRQELPALRVMSRRTLQDCFIRYALTGWAGYVPEACRGTLLLVPTNIGPWLWGWPHVFQRRLERYGTKIYAVGPYRGGEFSTGVNTREELQSLPDGYAGGIWTDRIDVISPLVLQHRPDASHDD
jgi:glycerophosphoryl diester phosphodiesterase